MNIRLLLFLAAFFMSAGMLAQRIVSGKVLSKKTGEPLAFATITAPPKNHQLTNIDGSFKITAGKKTKFLFVSYAGFKSKKIPLLKGKKTYTIFLEKKTIALEKVVLESNYLANQVIRKAIANKVFNNPTQKLNSFRHKTYTKFLIDNEKTAFELELDSARTEIETIVNTGRAFLSEKVLLRKFEKETGTKKTIIGTKTAGFKKPVYELLRVKVQSDSWYNNKYVIFDSEYAGPLGRNAFQNYRYKILDTTQTERPAYIVYFEPKRQRAVAGLQGILYLDTLSYAVQKANGQLKGKINIRAEQEYRYFPSEKIWFPIKKRLVLKPGKGGQDVSIFGGNISIGRISEKEKELFASPLFMESVSINFDIQLNKKSFLKSSDPALTLLLDATIKSSTFWKENRKIPFSEEDEATFARVDSIIKTRNIARKIEVVESFNQGYFPLGFFDFDLRYLIKVNNYEGFRLGIGGLTNENLSKKFRVGGYLVYGFKDEAYKYSGEVGVLLARESGTWLNLAYTKDLNEVGSFFYLTDRRVYSLFEPRLVNIDFYYKHQTIRASLQHRFTQKLLSEWQLSKDEISQTGVYLFRNEGKLYSKYDLTEATLSLRWSPFGKFLKAPGTLIELEKNYPLFSAQITQAFDGFLNGNFSYTKLGLKVNYTVDRINQSSTEVVLEGNLALGDVPLTHLFHAYPNNPNKETLLQRFSVAGRRSFETMYFSEFFSDKLATLQVKHKFRSFDFGPNFKPQFVLITRHAIGDMSEQDNHLGLKFNTLEEGYSETGFEINRIFAGFGLSFAYRYGAYHLPELEDNISFKFTFYFKL